MRLIEIGLDRFRNLRSTCIEIPPQGAVLIGSNGQGKTSGHAPVLLLDDVFAEVDAGRSRALLPCLGVHRQRLVTSARPLPGLETSLEPWEVSEGRIQSCAVAA